MWRNKQGARRKRTRRRGRSADFAPSNPSGSPLSPPDGPGSEHSEPLRIKELQHEAREEKAAYEIRRPWT